MYKRPLIARFPPPPPPLSLPSTTADVASEGLDFRRCQLVLCADVPKHVREFQQCAGRARAERAQMAVLVEAGDTPGHQAMRLADLGAPPRWLAAALASPPPLLPLLLTA
jgi:hypothetical protein